MTAESHEILIAIIGAIGGIIVALAIIHKNAADVRSKEKETDNQAGQLALNLATSLKTQLDSLELKSKAFEDDIKAMKDLIRLKDERIGELERRTKDQDDKLTDQDRQIVILRKLSQDKDERITDLKVRLEAVEKTNGAEE
jgi:predicted RNase H-like nuclease (RuvC/YqgF family)